jgi:hypothetical protein
VSAFVEENANYSAPYLQLSFQTRAMKTLDLRGGGRKIVATYCSSLKLLFPPLERCWAMIFDVANAGPTWKVSEAALCPRMAVFACLSWVKG